MVEEGHHKPGRPKGSKNKMAPVASGEAKNNGRSADQLARELTEAGYPVSGATVERIRFVQRSDDEETKALLDAGTIAPYTAYKIVRQRRWEREMAGVEAKEPGE